jgi:hypothetical protein
MTQTVEYIPNVQNPSIGTVATSDESGLSLTVTGIIRYNGGGKFTCAVKDTGTGLLSGNMDVYYSDGIWKAKKYIPVRYRDEEGVEKRM